MVAEGNNLPRPSGIVGEPGNVGFVCDECAPKPDPTFADQPFEWFVGRYCKLKFPTGLEDGPKFENMWVKVTGQDTVDGVQMLVGVLDNNPLYVREYSYGSGVAFERHEVCVVA